MMGFVNSESVSNFVNCSNASKSLNSCRLFPVKMILSRLGRYSCKFSAIRLQIRVFFSIFSRSNVCDFPLTQCGCCSAAGISCVARMGIRPVVEYHYPKNQSYRIDPVWLPYSRFVVFCILQIQVRVRKTQRKTTYCEF